MVLIKSLLMLIIERILKNFNEYVKEKMLGKGKYCGYQNSNLGPLAL